MERKERKRMEGKEKKRIEKKEMVRGIKEGRAG
jgi:hypothetical protein